MISVRMIMTFRVPDRCVVRQHLHVVLHKGLLNHPLRRHQQQSLCMTVLLYRTESSVTLPDPDAKHFFVIFS